MDFEQRRVTRDGDEVHLTPTEYEVLKYLAMNVGKVVTHRVLLMPSGVRPTKPRRTTCASSSTNSATRSSPIPAGRATSSPSLASATACARWTDPSRSSVPANLYAILTPSLFPAFISSLCRLAHT